MCPSHAQNVIYPKPTYSFLPTTDFSPGLCPMASRPPPKPQGPPLLLFIHLPPRARPPALPMSGSSSVSPMSGACRFSPNVPGDHAAHLHPVSFPFCTPCRLLPGPCHSGLQCLQSLPFASREKPTCGFCFLCAIQNPAIPRPSLSIVFFIFL